MPQNNVTDTTELNLVLQVQEINAILLSLQELPAKVANPLSNKIVEQTTPQIEKLNSQISLNLQSGAEVQEQLA